eukprot:CAMPEP_0182429308 /NCGR_PEP_ID=MMETSP1167-20130531/25671_1 /TAXON_ID=2988 /ORGANISM="Mallomonas Sp, Strain CCMP3275" /LENGTH=542 /DNA_ID=CAMNT_0024612745 /DNA_START=544 /DNA_END=2172 /DNA_ORIENTATION=-
MKFTYNERISDGVQYNWISFTSADHLLSNSVECESCEEGSLAKWDKSDEYYDTCLSRRSDSGYSYGSGASSRYSHYSYGSGSKSDDSVSRSHDDAVPVAEPTMMPTPGPSPLPTPQPVDTAAAGKSKGGGDVVNYANQITTTAVVSGKGKGGKGKSLRALGASDDRNEDDEAYPIMDYALYGKEKYTWDTYDTYKSAVHVSDTAGENLYFTGSLCGSTYSSSPCDLYSLPPGEYNWRVTGAQNPNVGDVAFDFCGVHGPALTEVVFQLDCDGDCVPLSVRGLTELCVAQGETDFKYSGVKHSTAVTLKGTVHLEGVVDRELSPDDVSLVQNTLSRSFLDARSDKSSGDENLVEILSWDVVSGTHRDSARQLEESASHRINFHVTITSEDYNVDGTNVDKVDALVGDLSAYLHHSMVTGVFTSKLVSQAFTMNLQNLQSVHSAKLQDLRVSVVHKSVLNTEMSVLADVVVVGGALMGLVAGILLMRWMSSRDQQKDDKKLSVTFDLEGSRHTGTNEPMPNTLRLSTIHDLTRSVTDRNEMVML